MAKLLLRQGRQFLEKRLEDRSPFESEKTVEPSGLVHFGTELLECVMPLVKGTDPYRSYCNQAIKKAEEAGADYVFPVLVNSQFSEKSTRFSSILTMYLRK